MLNHHAHIETKDNTGLSIASLCAQCNGAYHSCGMCVAMVLVLLLDRKGWILKEAVRYAIVKCNRSTLYRCRDCYHNGLVFSHPYWLLSSNQLFLGIGKYEIVWSRENNFYLKKNTFSDLRMIMSVNIMMMIMMMMMMMTAMMASMIITVITITRINLEALSG